jgi:hypothetical protein
LVIKESCECKEDKIGSDIIIEEFIKSNVENVTVDWEDTHRPKMSVYQGLKDYCTRNDIDVICYISCGEIHLQRKVK